MSGVPASAAAATKVFAPNNWLSPRLSGEATMAPRKMNFTPPRVTASPGCRPRLAAADGSSSRPGRPAARVAKAPAGAVFTWPSKGQPGPSARTAASARRPDGAIRIERVSTVSETRAPCAVNQAGTAGGNGARPVESSMSPPRMPRPLSAMPCCSAARSEKMPATAATPTARQSSTMAKPRAPPRRAPPRKSRHARTQASFIRRSCPGAW